MSWNEAVTRALRSMTREDYRKGIRPYVKGHKYDGKWSYHYGWK